MVETLHKHNMEGDEFIMSVGFRNITKCQISEGISASDTIILLENTADYVPFTSSPGEYVYAVLINHEYTEMVKIDVAESSINGLSVERGQEYTSARAWNRGTLFYQDLTASSLSLLLQKEVFRTFAYNPNGIISPAYAYEEVYQTGDEACEIRWWKAVNDTNLVWMLIAGTICEGEEWLPPAEWDWDIPEDWEWPTIVYKVAPPIYLPSAGSYTIDIDVEIFCPTLNSTTYYTDDGSTPDDNSTEYTELISLTKNITTLKAIAYKPDFGESPVVEARFILPFTFDIVDRSGSVGLGQIESGEIVGWGYNGWGQLAQGSITGVEWSPILVSEDTTWSAIACGQNFILGIKGDGTLWSCGNNTHGQLGIGSPLNKTSLVQVGTSTDWEKVYTGDQFAFGIKSDGSLWGWGLNDWYMLGLDDTTKRTSPVQIGVLTDWAFVTGNQSTTVAIKTDGTMWGWGRNDRYELGLGDTDTKTTPTQIGGDLETWAEVAIGAMGCIAVKTDGTLWGWGYNSYGQCGQDDIETYYTTPVQVGDAETWKAVAGGLYSRMATQTDGTLWGWGRNTYGELGLEDEETYLVPTQIGEATFWDYPVGTSTNSVMSAVKINKVLYSSGLYLNGALGIGEVDESVNFFTRLANLNT